MTEHDALDRAIDEVARDLTSGEPSHALRTRVVERIERPRRAAWMWQLATALTVVLVVAYLMWPRAEITSEPAVVATAPSRTTPAPAADNTAVVRAQPSEHLRALKGGPGARRPQQGPATRRIAVDPTAPQIAALVEMNELAVSLAEPRNIDVPGLRVDDVSIPPLEPGDKERR